MSQTQKRGFDYTTVLLLIVIVATFIGMFVKPIEPPEFDWDAAQSPVRIYFHNVRLECALEGIREDYSGEYLVLDTKYTKNGEKYQLVDIYGGVLVGTNIRHVRLTRIPENVDPNAFAGVEGVTVYVDQMITEDMQWAQHVTIASSEDFNKLINPGTSYKLVFSWEQFMTSVKNIAGDERVMLITAVPLALAMFLLCFLRQKNGRGNPLWPVFRSGFGKWAFLLFSFTVGLVTAVTLFCEEADVGMDLYGVVEFMLGWPLKVLAVFAGLFLLGDLLQKDFPWFFARWVIRAAITALVMIFCAIVGWVAATIVTENLAMFKILYILGLILFVSFIFGGGGKVNEGIKTKMESSMVIAENGSSMRVDHYSHGTYVGDDQIVGFGSDTMTGASGKVYKKY